MDSINQIKVGRIFDAEVVVTVSDAGDIWIWRTDALDEPPMTIKYANYTRNRCINVLTMHK